ncbi:hypothetical protein BGX33_006668 [Mortierella sp. NVP41]|nr:hypothetical protein BGX33_006668 [Mortierella sp. NVP41]
MHTDALEGNSFWTVTLSRIRNALQVTCLWNRMQNQDTTNYTMMHIAPRSEHLAICKRDVCGSDLMNNHMHQCVIDIQMVEDDGMYRFDIVFSTSKEIGKKLACPPKRSHEITPRLLKDINSLDVYFTFPSRDKKYSVVHLWAHRAALSRYKAFAQLFGRMSTDRSSGSKADSNKKDKPSSASTIKHGSYAKSECNVCEDRVIETKVEKISLATFCVLLYYIYTDEIDLSIDISRFVLMVKAVGTSQVWRVSEGKNQDSEGWNYLDKGLPWELKDVTWAELLMAAEYYGITELQARCRAGALNSLSERNAVRLLFSKDPFVKSEAMSFVVNQMGSFFENIRDHFAPFNDHPGFNNILMELLQIKAKKA